MKKPLLTGLCLMFLCGAAARPDAETAFNVTFVNRSGYPNTQIYLYVTGNDGAASGYLDLNTQSFVTPRVSNISQMTATLDSIGGSANVTVPIPLGISQGRIYFSYGGGFDTLDFDPVNGQPGYGPHDLLLYDKIEFFSGDSSQLNMNSTNVDFFSLPFTFSAVDKNTGQRVTYGFQVNRNAIFDAFAAIPETPADQVCGNTAIFRDGLVQVSNGTTWRVVAPDKVAKAEWPGDNFKRFSYFWNDYVKDRCWVPGRTISLRYNNTDYTGTVNGTGETLSWSPGDETYNRPAWTTLPDPPPDPTDANYGHVIFGGTGEFTDGLLAPIVNSSIQRGVMHLEGSEWDNSAKFYQGTNSPDSPVNHYGKILHHYAVNHQCYALAYDDGFGYNTSIYVNQGDTYTITLHPLAGSGRHPWIHDYNGDGTSDIAIFRPGTGLWAIKGISRAYFGSGPDIPVPGDYLGNGTTDIGIFRPASGLWAVKGLTRVYFGTTGDVPVTR